MAMLANTAEIERPQPMRPLNLTEADTAVRLRNISKRFVIRRSVLEIVRHPFRWNHQQALRDVTCDIKTGEFFGLLGPNGAGKTTLFKILATFVTPDSGTAVVSGHDLGTNPAQVRQLVTPAVADERSLRWRLTARENLRLYATLYDVPREGMLARVDELLLAVGLHETGNKLVGQFSTGMKQRLLIARALIPKPKILLLDEPTRGLDPLLARSFRKFLREEIGRRQGCTVLLATHNAEEAFELCDRVAVLDRGRLLVVGSADDLAEEFGHQRYRVWTRTPHHRSFDELARQGVARVAPDERTSEDGWTVVELELLGGPDRAAEVVHELVGQGAVVARFERVGTSLADLIERVVLRSKDGKEDRHA
jgi:ABC-2 type transport system ATP-binding protein